MSDEWWVHEWFESQHREWLAGLSMADVEERWLGSGDGSTFSEYMERLFS